jgi:hypothetical protein
VGALAGEFLVELADGEFFALGGFIHHCLPYWVVYT